MIWLITGGCGFIGSALTRRILAQCPEDKIRLLDNCTIGTPDSVEFFISKSEREKVEIRKGDVTQQNEVTSVMDGVDFVVHLAANTGVRVSIERPLFDFNQNALGTFNVLNVAARKTSVKKFVFASSGSVLGVQEPPIHEKMNPSPISPYAASKLCGEAYCSAFSEYAGLSCAILRFSNAYGPGSWHKTSLITKYIKASIDGQPFEIFGDGEQTRDFIFVEDLCDAIIKAANYERRSCEIFQISTGIETSVNAVLERLSAEIDNVGLRAAIIKNVKPVSGELRRNHASPSKAHDLLGWCHQTTLSSGIRETVADLVKKAL